jgi:hypothetical protein
MCRVRRRLVLALILLACAVLAGASAWLFWPRTAITRANAEKIEEGMTRAEVEALLGGPHRDDATGPTVLDTEDGDELALARLRRYIDLQVIAAMDAEPIWIWRSNQVEIHVRFDGKEQVVSCDSINMRPASQGALAMLRRWLGL